MENTYIMISKFDRQKLSVLEMDTQKKLRGVIQIVHGMCEYKERYRPFMEYMAKRGFASIIHDHRGHGASVDSLEDLGYMKGGSRAILEDIAQVQEHMREKYSSCPYIFLGHSMGSMAVRTYLKKNDNKVDAVILTGSPSKNPALPLGKIAAKVQGVIQGKRHPSKLIEAMSFGPYAARFANEKSKFSWVCANPEVVGEYDNSKFCGFTYTVDGYKGLFDIVGRTYSRKGWQCKQPDLPILFMSGRDDPCMGNVRKFKKTLDFLRSVGYYNVRGKIYPDMRHEILNEVHKEKVYHDICSYIISSVAACDI